MSCCGHAMTEKTKITIEYQHRDGAGSTIFRFHFAPGPVKGGQSRPHFPSRLCALDSCPANRQQIDLTSQRSSFSFANHTFPFLLTFFSLCRSCRPHRRTCDSRHSLSTLSHVLLVSRNHGLFSPVYPSLWAHLLGLPDLARQARHYRSHTSVTYIVSGPRCGMLAHMFSTYFRSS